MVVVMVGALSLTLTAFTPSPSNHTKGLASGSPDPATGSVAPRRDPNDPSAARGYLERLQRGVATSTQRQCAAIRLRTGDNTQLCQRVIHDPSQVAKAAKTARQSRVQKRTSDPKPPEELCGRKPGQVNYDRFHACGESLLRLELADPRGGLPATADIVYWVWATLDAKNPTWLMQVGLQPIKMDFKIMKGGFHETASLVCAKDHCKVPDPQRSTIALNVYTYYALPTLIPDAAPGTNIKYSNPQIKLTVSANIAIPQMPDAYLVTPFNIRCDKESYIGGHGCVYYMGNAAAGTFYLDYKNADPAYGDYREVVKHNLYGMVVRDNLKHYGHIGYGNPLHRTDDATQTRNRNSICSAAIRKRNPKPKLLECDEWPYASSEEGGATNPRFSCTFLPSDQNGNHGNALNNMFRAQRILPAVFEDGRDIPGDPYWVWVLNAPPDDKIPTSKQCSTYPLQPLALR